MKEEEEENIEHMEEQDTSSKASPKKSKKGKTVSRDKYEILEQEKAELNDKFVRLFAEFDNYKKRTSRERLELLQTASKGLIMKMLPVMDDFERAITSMETDELEQVKEGVDLLKQKFWGILQSEGVQPVDAMEQEFDVDFHEALTKIPAPTEELVGKVVDVIEKGYKQGDKIIRFSKVVIGE
jgi:molecular chaperone GrpE